MLDLTDPVQVVAGSAWGEARGCGAAGMGRVVSVIANRVHHPRWWGHDWIGVCRAPWQFSCWNSGDPNRAKILAVTSDDRWFAIATRLATDAISGALPDTTDGADSYFAIGSRVPAWVERAKHTMSDAWHAFYRIELPAPSGQPEAACLGAAVAADSPDLSADDLNAAELAPNQEVHTGQATTASQ